MKRILVVCLFALTMAPSKMHSATVASGIAGYQKPSFAGIWQGKINDLPGIKLKIQEIDTKIAGTVTFYLQKRAHANAPWHVAGESTMSLLAARRNGESLIFEVQHHRCHECSELGPDIQFRMTLTGSNEARLWNLSEKADLNSGVRLYRKSESTDGASQRMQEGVSVDLPHTNSAGPMPDADQEDALIVSVTEQGELYFGITPVSAIALTENLKRNLSHATDKQLFIKADARSRFDTLSKVLVAAREGGVKAPVLLTAQRALPGASTPVPPNGLDVTVDAEDSANSKSILLDVLNSGHATPTLKINNQRIHWAALHNTLMLRLQNGAEKSVRVNADGSLPVSQVVNIIDTCHSLGAKVILLKHRA
jgi:biopolymer transport protein TolR